MCFRAAPCNVAVFFGHFLRERHEDMLRYLTLLLLTDESMLASLESEESALLRSYSALREEVSNEFSAILGVHRAHGIFVNAK